MPPDVVDPSPKPAEPVDPVATQSLSSVQKTLGLLFTPVGLIALLCNLLGISGQNTAAISLASILLTAIILYRGYINRTIPSAILCGLIVGLIAVFGANYEHILFKDTGLVRYFHTGNDFLGQVGPFLEKAKQEIWLSGVDFHITATDRKLLILKKLREGVKVRFLVFDPESPFLQKMAPDFDQSPAQLESECHDSIEGLIRLRKEWLNDPASQRYPEGLEIHLFEEVPHARFYLVDPDDSNARSFFIPYMNHMNSPELPGYLLGNVKGGVIQEYLPGVRKLWNTSEPLNTYLAQHPGLN